MNQIADNDKLEKVIYLLMCNSCLFQVIIL